MRIAASALSGGRVVIILGMLMLIGRYWQEELRAVTQNRRGTSGGGRGN
jgi:hypothetical protein